MKITDVTQITMENREIGKTWAERLEEKGLLFGRPVCGSGLKIALHLQEGNIHSFEDAKKMFMDEAAEKGIHSYKLYWDDEKTEYVYGASITDAINKAGIGRGALPALDFYEEVA